MSKILGNHTLRIGKGQLRKLERNAVLPLVFVVFLFVPVKACFLHAERVARIGIVAIPMPILWYGSAVARLSRRELVLQRYNYISLLAAGVDVAVSFGDLFERIAAIDDRFEFSCLGQLR